MVCPCLLLQMYAIFGFKVACVGIRIKQIPDQMARYVINLVAPLDTVQLNNGLSVSPPLTHIFCWYPTEKLIQLILAFESSFHEYVIGWSRSFRNTFRFLRRSRSILLFNSWNQEGEPYYSADQINSNGSEVMMSLIARNDDNYLLITVDVLKW